jgi:hypothetical protein
VLIDIDDVRNDIPGVIALKGYDYEYEKPEHGNCVYVDDSGAPSCLVGYYLINNLKVPVEWFEGGSGDRNYKEFTSLTGVLYTDRGISFTREAEDFLRKLQELQDAGMAWGAALEYALNPDIDDEDEDDE